MQCSVYIAASLDGFIARTDGGIDWLSIVQRDGEDYGYSAFFDSVDTVIVGRKTYEMALGFDEWPYSGKRCIVLTHTDRESRHGEEFHAGDPAELVRFLRGQGAGRAYVDGGAVIQQFLHAGLVTDLTLSIVPILLGTGIRLFADPGRDLRLVLRGVRGFESGLVRLEYAPAER